MAGVVQGDCAASTNQPPAGARGPDPGMGGKLIFQPQNNARIKGLTRPQKCQKKRGVRSAGVKKKNHYKKSPSPEKHVGPRITVKKNTHAIVARMADLST